MQSCDMGLDFRQRAALFLHRQVWQRLPKRARRSAIEAAADLLAPRSEVDPQAGGAVAVAGVLRASSGLGHSARLCEKALRATGQRTAAIDLTHVMMANSGDRPEELAESVPEGPGSIIVHVNSPLLPLALLSIGKRRLKGKLIVGYWAWELPETPPSWRRGIPYVHEIWVPSRFVARAVAPPAGDAPVLVVPHPVMVDRPDGPLVQAPPPSERFDVLTAFDMSSGFSRKNPLASIAAFKRAFGHDTGARLVVKIIRGETYRSGLEQIRAAIRGHGNIVLDERARSHQDFMQMLGEADVFISLHRSEGFGLILAEAMAAGTCVIATDWSGNTDFLHTENSMPVGYRLVGAEDPQGEYAYPHMQWAEPDVDAAAAALVRLRDDPTLRQRLVARAFQDAERGFGVEAYRGALDQRSRLRLAP